MIYRPLSKIQLVVWWLLLAECRMEKGRLSKWPGGGWLLTIKQPNGGWSTIPARTRLGCWARLLRNQNGMGFYVAW